MRPIFGKSAKFCVARSSRLTTDLAALGPVSMLTNANNSSSSSRASGVYSTTPPAMPEIHERLLARKRDARSVLAAPHPLVFEEVAYPSNDELLARAELTRALRE